MYAVISFPFVSRTRAIFRRAEFGFFGVIVFTWRHTPRRCGHLSRTGDLLRLWTFWRPLRTSWLKVGMSSWLRFPCLNRAGPPEGAQYHVTDGYGSSISPPSPSL